jgi:hypothetical protein
MPARGESRACRRDYFSAKPNTTMKTLKTGEDCIVHRRPTTDAEWTAERNLTVELDSKSPALVPGDRIFLGMEQCVSGKNSGGIDEVYAVIKDFEIDDIKYQGEDYGGDWPVEVTFTVTKLAL